MTVRARREAVDLTPVLDAVTNDWEPGKVIAERAGIDPRTAGPRLAALQREGKVEFTLSEELEVRVYRLARDLPPAGDVTILDADSTQVVVSEISWQPQAPMTFEAWADAGARLQFMSRALNWLVGDWLLYGELNYGEMYTQAIDTTGLDVQTLMNIASVARRVEPERRRESLSWSHHEAVAALAPGEQEEWLARAEEEGMTRNRLRSRLQGVSKDAPDPDQQLAPTHIARITIKFTAESDERAHETAKAYAALLERKGGRVSHKQVQPL